MRPAIHCNVVIFTFVSEKSLAPSLPELGCLLLFQGKAVRRGKENRRPSPQPRQCRERVGWAREAAAEPAGLLGRDRGRGALPGPTRGDLRTGSEGFFSPGHGRMGASQAIARASPEGAEPGAPLVSAGPGGRRKALLQRRERLRSPGPPKRCGDSLRGGLDPKVLLCIAGWSFQQSGYCKFGRTRGSAVRVGVGWGKHPPPGFCGFAGKERADPRGRGGGRRGLAERAVLPPQSSRPAALLRHR